MNIIADLHTHTTFSNGKGSVLDNVTAAMTRGLKAIGITDHGPRSAPWTGASLGDLRQMLADVREMDRRVVGLKIMAGVECNVTSLRGDLDVPRELRDQMDIVLAGLHPGILPRSGRDWLALAGGNWAARLGPGWRRRARVANTTAIIEAVLRNDIDLITHPGHHLDIDTAELAKVCALRNTALEINARHHAVTVEFCRTAAREGCKFLISSDAHRPTDVGNVARGLAVARAAGLGPSQVLNLEGGNLFEWLKQKRSRATWADWAEQPPQDRERTTEREEPRAGRRPSYFADWSSQGKIH